MINQYGVRKRLVPHFVRFGWSCGATSVERILQERRRGRGAVGQAAATARRKALRKCLLTACHQVIIELSTTALGYELRRETVRQYIAVDPSGWHVWRYGGRNGRLRRTRLVLLLLRVDGHGEPNLSVLSLNAGLKKATDEQRLVFETANRYHFIHTLALLAVPLTNRPNLVRLTNQCYAAS